MSRLKTAIGGLACAALLVASPPATAESPHIYGFHSWSAGCDIDVMNGKTGWYVFYHIVWYSPDISSLQQAKGEGFTIIMGLFDDWDDEIPADRDDWPAFADRCADIVDQVKDYVHIFHLDNEMEGDQENPNEYAECFRMVRDAIKAVDPEAIVTNGGVHDVKWFEPMARRLGDEIDGYQSHVNIPPDCMAVLDHVPGGARKPYYITEFTKIPYESGWIRDYYAAHNDWNLTHEHTSACACWFVYDLYGWYDHSLKWLPEPKADYQWVTANTNYTNDYATRPVTISDVRIDILDSSAVSVSWTTDIPSTTQVEWYGENASVGHVTSFDPHLARQHSATFSGCVPDYKYYLWVRSTAQDYGDAAQRFSFGTNTSWSPGGWLRQGWNLVSLPLEPADGRVEAVFDTLAAYGNELANSVFAYDGAYLIYPADFTSVEAGKGYWLNLSTATSEYCEGYAPTEDVHIPLRSGWNLIGQPHDYGTALASCSVTDGVLTLSFDDAAAAGWVEQPLYFYGPDGYSACRTSGGDDDTLRPWYGYWILSLKDNLHLVIP